MWVGTFTEMVCCEIPTDSAHRLPTGPPILQMENGNPRSLNQPPGTDPADGPQQVRSVSVAVPGGLWEGSNVWLLSTVLPPLSSVTLVRRPPRAPPL